MELPSSSSRAKTLSCLLNIASRNRPLARIKKFHGPGTPRPPLPTLPQLRPPPTAQRPTPNVGAVTHGHPASRLVKILPGLMCGRTSTGLPRVNAHTAVCAFCSTGRQGKVTFLYRHLVGCASCSMIAQQKARQARASPLHFRVCHVGSSDRLKKPKTWIY